jgi:hypothetical protein
MGSVETLSKTVLQRLTINILLAENITLVCKSANFRKGFLQSYIFFVEKKFTPLEGMENSIST